MVKLSTLVAFVGLVLSPTAVSAHPGEHPFSPEKRQETLKKQAFSHMVAHNSKRTLDAACGGRAEDVAARQQRAMERRYAKFQELRKQHNLDHLNTVERRANADFARYNAASHNLTGLRHWDSDTPSHTVFGANTSCVLTPDNIEGPYFVWGEDVRSDLTDGQPGIPMHLELQLIDVETCLPAQAVLVDVWACNATGAYSGVSAAGQGGLNTTFLRGVQMSNADGVVAFDTNFPGHYLGRATHQHVVAHIGAALAATNQSYTGGTVAHISQLFFDQALIHQVEQTSPYNANPVPLTTNAQDLFTGFAASPTYDPFVEYVFVGDNADPAYGLLAWVELGINTSLNYDAYAAPAAFRYEGGSVDNANFFEEQIVGAFPPPTHG
ncbi:hypothetical protein HMPREF1624_02368 [Sporothrix schenckii ATCC 58251]|uniref:Intradiol ring-cleavage dioxygenases domain-containing protein n=1 Tax=Sporothrix schenckii (strain ATCC 58251 / de Perez 2211183) TaxID=1391915 RepID=U7PZP9_SPOS1|nr:hypothetical protein HMPREF1624_02368 [Sporothrix schenckii ATCC 58251]